MAQERELGYKPPVESIKDTEPDLQGEIQHMRLSEITNQIGERGVWDVTVYQAPRESNSPAKPKNPHI